MIKFVSILDNDDKLIGFGLSEGNVKRLKANEPILINLGKVLGYEYQDIEVIIFYGETEESITRDLMKYIGPETKIHIGKKGDQDEN